MQSAVAMVTRDGLLALAFGVLLCRLCLQPRFNFSLADVQSPSRLNGEGWGGVGGQTQPEVEEGRLVGRLGEDPLLQMIYLSV